MKRNALLSLALISLCALSSSADPREVLAGDWWGTMAERRLSLAADGTLTEFRPTDVEERKGSWEIDGSTVKIQYADRKRAEAYTFSVVKDELTLTGEDGRSTQLKKEARADREKRLAGILVGQLKKQRESEEEPDQSKRAQLIKESRALGVESEPLIRSLVGATHEKQDALKDGLVKANAPELLTPADAAVGATGPGPEIKPRKTEPATAKRDCVNHLKQIGIYMALFESKFKRYPKSLKEVQRPDMMTDLSLLNCPADGEGEEKAYGYCEPAKGDETPPDAVCAWDAVPHADGTRNVLFFQGRVGPMKEDDFRKALAAAGGKLTNAAARSRGVKARAEIKDGKVVVTVRAKVIDLVAKTVDGKEHVKARVLVTAILDGGDSKPVESGVRVVEGELATDGYPVELTITLPIADVEKIDALTLSVEDRMAGETGETRILGKNVEKPK